MTDREINMDEALEAAGIQVFYLETEEDFKSLPPLDSLLPHVPLPEIQLEAPNCFGCKLPIEKPGDMPEHALRLGFFVHTTCINIMDNLLASWRQIFGVPYCDHDVRHQ